MKGLPIDQLVFECVFPKPRPSDPQTFQALLQRHLVPEVRLETQAFYGHLSSQEAKYPGLDYSYQPHRNRLSRFPWHRRLFRAFETLRLTHNEIAQLTKWEGTRWAKERFEKEQGVVIRDTTSDGIEDWVEPELRVTTGNVQPQRADVEEMEGIQKDDAVETRDNEADGNMDEDSEADMESVGIELNERLRAAVAEREAGNTATVMDEEWEQWLKDAVEAGGIPFLSPELSPDANIPGTRPAGTTALHPRLANAARLGQSHQIPDILHSMARHNAEANRLDDTPLNAATASLLNNTASPFLTRPSLSPRARAVHPASTTEPSTVQRLASRLDNHFAEYFSRRPVPPLPSPPDSTAMSNIGSARRQLVRDQQSSSQSTTSP